MPPEGQTGTPNPNNNNQNILGQPPSGGANGGTPPPQSWKDSLPDDLKGDPSLIAINDIPALAKSYIHAQKAIGAEKIVIPGKNATDQDWQNVFRKLGHPESLDKYELKAPENADKAFLDNFKKAAFENGILPKQAEKLMGWYQEMSKGSLQAQDDKKKADREQGIQALQKEWGTAFEREANTARIAQHEFGDKEFNQFLSDNNLLNHPVMVKFMNRVGNALAEDKIKGAGDGQMGMTPDEAMQKINAILGDPKHPYHDAYHPTHQAAIDEVQKLFAAKNGKRS